MTDSHTVIHVYKHPLQDDFYLRHVIKNCLLDPVMEAFFANGDRYNLLNSAVLEMVEFIRKENLKVRPGWWCSV